MNDQPVSALLEALRLTTEPSRRLEQLQSAPPAWRAVLERLVRGPDPELALRQAASLFERGACTDLPPLHLASLLHQGSYAGRLAALDPAAIEHAASPMRPSADHLRRMFAELRTNTSAAEALGRLRTREYLRLLRREVEGAPLEEVGSDLGQLAAVCIDLALAETAEDLTEDVVVLGMGKLGGRELNFLSDIDLVFVERDDPHREHDRVATNRMHEHLQQVVRLLSGDGPWRPMFHVDLRLRPFGSRGPIVMSLSATESYYERYGRDWERQVWIRARPIAGNLALGEALLMRLSPFVWRRSMSPAIFDEISRLMLRARREARRGVGLGTDIDVKLDAGGIREIEFFVQGMQLLHGGKNSALRTPSTLEALDRLLAVGLISDREHRQLTEAYRWLRRVEHRLQLADGRQTHRIPPEVEARTRLAARLADETDEGRFPEVLGVFEATLGLHRMRVGAIAQTLHGPSTEPEIERSESERARAQDAVLDAGAPTVVQIEALSRLGVRDPEEAHALLRHLYSRREGAFAIHGEIRRGAERLLLACLDSADPDAALQRLVEFAGQRPAHHGIWRFFADADAEANEILRLTAELLGSSEPMSRGLIGTGAASRAVHEDSISLLLDARNLRALPDRAVLEDALQSFPPDERGTDATLLRFKHRELVCIGLYDLGRRPDPLEVGHALSELADTIVERIVAELLIDPGYAGLRLDLGVFALGKYGMQAMDYGSDLDLMFVFAPPEHPEDPGTALQVPATMLARRLLTRLASRSHGARLYQVDTRLRPSGRQGLLVSSLAAFRRYHSHPLPVWERLANLRNRPVATFRFGALGSPSIAAAVSEQVLPDSFRAPLSADGNPAQGRIEVARAVRSLKNRIELEIARETRETYNAKTGEGASLELELLVSALQLLLLSDHPGPPARGIIEAMHGLAGAGFLAKEEATDLAAAYRFQRLLLNRLRMGATGGAEDPDRFALSSPRLVALARRMGRADRDTLIDEYLHHRRTVRAAFDRHLPLP